MQPYLTITVASVFGLVALVSASVSAHVLAHYTPGRRRLRGLAQATAGDQAQVRHVVDLPDPKLARLARFVPKSPEELSRLRRRLARAGYRSFGASVAYRLLEVACPVVFGLAPFVLRASFGREIWMLAAFGAAIGFFLPGLVLDRKIANRQKQIRNGLPDALDLFIVCVEAGSSLDQAITKAREELALSHPALAEELELVTMEIKAGKPRLEAFRNFAERTKVDDVRSLVTILVQTERFGTSIARALRTHADVARTKRRQRAEEKAQKIGVKLVFPLVFCLFPAFYVVTLGPAAIQYVRVFRAEIVQSTGR